LRALTVKAIELFAAAANLPHSVDGFVIFIGTHRYIVTDECSGLAYVTLAIFLGYCFGFVAVPLDLQDCRAGTVWRVPGV
jgi:hypothetical protein